MTEIIYSKPGEEQFLDLRFKFKVLFTPGNKGHLTQLLTKYLHEKGIEMEEVSHKIDVL